MLTATRGEIFRFLNCGALYKGLLGSVPVNMKTDMKQQETDTLSRRTSACVLICKCEGDYFLIRRFLIYWNLINNILFYDWSQHVLQLYSVSLACH